MKKNKIMSWAGRWEWEMITLSEVSWTQKTNILCFLSYVVLGHGSGEEFFGRWGLRKNNRHRNMI